MSTTKSQNSPHWEGQGEKISRDEKIYGILHFEAQPATM